MKRDNKLFIIRVVFPCCLVFFAYLFLALFDYLRHNYKEAVAVPDMTLAEDQTLGSSVLGSLGGPGKWVVTDAASTGNGRHRMSFIKVLGDSGVGVATTLALDELFHREARWKWFLVAPGDTVVFRRYYDPLRPIYKYDASSLLTLLVYPQRVANAYLGHEVDFYRLETLTLNPNIRYVVKVNTVKYMWADPRTYEINEAKYEFDLPKD